MGNGRPDQVMVMVSGKTIIIIVHVSFHVRPGRGTRA
jgi:hypothetical protein